MKNPTTILDVSKGVGFGMLYHPVIGKNRTKSFPFLSRSLLLRSKKIKKVL